MRKIHLKTLKFKNTKDFLEKIEKGDILKFETGKTKDVGIILDVLPVKPDSELKKWINPNVILIKTFNLVVANKESNVFGNFVIDKRYISQYTLYKS